MTNKYIKSDSSGRMWIDTEDFFKQEKIQEIIKQFIQTDLYKRLTKNKK